MSSRLLNDLDPNVRPIFFELIARCIEAGIAVAIVNVMRTPQEQAENIKKGVSWTKHSRHLPQPPSNKSHAIDLAPYDTYKLHGALKYKWDNDDPAWQVMGKIGESLGLRWGGRWEQMDMGHFEWNPPSPVHIDPSPVTKIEASAALDKTIFGFR